MQLEEIKKFLVLVLRKSFKRWKGQRAKEVYKKRKVKEELLSDSEDQDTLGREAFQRMADI